MRRSELKRHFCHSYHLAGAFIWQQGSCVSSDHVVHPIHFDFIKIARYWFQGLQGLINDKHRRYERISSIPDLILVSFIQATGCPRKKSLIKFFLDDFPTDVDYGPTFSWTVKHPWRPGHSLKKVAGSPLASDQGSGDKVCGWSVVHVRWEVVKEKFYQRLFSGTPCSYFAHLHA